LLPAEASEMILQECGINDAFELKGFEKKKRTASIKHLKNMGISTRQLARLTGISRIIILKA
jgi:putative transposase